MSTGRLGAGDTAIQPTIFDAKADILTATAADTPARLAVGSDNQVLTVDSSTATGLKWATPATDTNGFVLIKRATFTNVANTGTTFDGVFSSTYRSYYAIFENVGAATSGDEFRIQMRYAGPTTEAGAYYSNSINAGVGSTTVTNSAGNGTTYALLCTDIGTTSEGSTGFLLFHKVGNSNQTAQFVGQFENGESVITYHVGCRVNTARTYTGFILSSSSSNISGTVAVYGLAV